MHGRASEPEFDPGRLGGLLQLGVEAIGKWNAMNLPLAPLRPFRTACRHDARLALEGIKIILHTGAEGLEWHEQGRIDRHDEMAEIVAERQKDAEAASGEPSAVLKDEKKDLLPKEWWEE